MQTYTHALHLDADFRAYPKLESIPFEAFQFAGGEPHIKLGNVESNARVIITQRAKSWQDLGMVAIAVDALRRAGAGNIALLLPYLPGARQDRVMVPGEPLTVKVYCDFLNSLALKRITIFDPHSSVGPALLSDVEVIDNVAFAKTVLADLPENTLLVSPDAGAQKKVYAVAQALDGQYPVIDAGKHRDVRTGELTGFAVYVYDKQIKGEPCLILDDICDGGGTFLGLAKALKQEGAGNLYLAVSHGIFSKGTEVLTKVFKHVYCTDAFSTLPTKVGITQVPLAQLL